MKNEDFINNKQWENKINLQSIMQSKVLKSTGVELPVEMCRVILSYINPSKQLYIECYDLRKVKMPRHIANGYTFSKDLLTRNIVTPIVGEIKIGYRQKDKILRSTKLHADLTVLKMTSITTGSVNRKFINQIKETLIILREVHYENRSTDIKDYTEVVQE